MKTGRSSARSSDLLWEFSTDDWVFSTPYIADLNGDGDLDLAFGNGVHESNEGGGQVYALDYNGEELWNYTTGGDVQSSPTAYDVDLDGFVEVLIGSNDGYLYSLNGSNGHLKWRYKVGTDQNRNLESSPAVVDLDDDGDIEIIITGGRSGLLVLDAQGRQLWSGVGIAASSPTVADLDGNGRLEVISSNNTDVFVYSNTGEKMWNTRAGWYIASSPAVGDLDGNGILDIVVGAIDRYLYAIDGNGTLMWKAYVGDGVRTSPTIYDVDQDGAPEIYLETEGPNASLVAVSNEGRQLWSKKLNNGYSSPAVADINNDNELEIIAGNWGGTLYYLDSDGNVVGENQEAYQVSSSPVVADIDGDGFLEVIVSSTDGNNDKGAVQCFRTSTSSPKKSIIWQTLQKDRWHTGNPLLNPTDWDFDGYENEEDAFDGDPAASLDSDADGYPDEWNEGKSPDDSTTNLTLDLFPDDPNKSIDTDKDGIHDHLDAFPNDPAASLDSDRDGYPDEWNEGKSQVDSTTGLKIDDFTNDSNEWVDTDDDGTGDNGDAFPNDPAASVDSDGDGYPDEWNPGKTQGDSTTGLRLDEYPEDPDRWLKNPFEPDYLYAPTLPSTGIILVSIVIFQSRRKR